MKNSREMIIKRAHSGTQTHNSQLWTSSVPFVARLFMATLFMEKLHMTTRNYILGLPKYFTMISMLMCGFNTRRRNVFAARYLSTALNFRLHTEEVGI